MLPERYPYWLANRAVHSDEVIEVLDKYTGEIATRVALAGRSVIDEAIGRAVEAAEPMRRLAAYERQAVLSHCAARFEARADELAQALCVEAGKPIKDSRGEVSRLVDTFRIAAEESVRLKGEIIPLDISERAKQYTGMWKRYPIGPCSFISPFNFPLNLAAHKVAPALAVGCPFLLKPASLTPVGALIIGEVLAECDLPEGAFSILPCPRDAADLFTTDDRFKLLSFTGSPGVGWDLKSKAGKKKVVLELGGNAACIVHEDADIDDAIERIIIGAFYQSGQSCISVQRLLIHAPIYATFRDRLVAATRELRAGDPKSEETFIGPIISEKEARRIEAWVQSAIDHGARLLCGGGRMGSIVEATLLEDVPSSEAVCSEEVFGPVAVLDSYDDFGEALERTNDSAFGLQAGLFTRDVFRIHRAWDELEVGGLMVNEVPSWRVDHMPYGGVKDSGLGREGIVYAMEDMTEIRFLGLRDTSR